MIDAAAAATDPNWSADVVIVGSGASGSVWAERLARAGKDVLILEEGGWFQKEHFTQREEEMYPLLYRDGSNQLTADQTVQVLQGSCVGGSTVINMADVERIPDAVLEYWRRETGIAEFRPDVFRPYFERCEQVIGANQIGDEDLNRNNLLLRKGTEALNYKGANLRHNRVGCIGSGYCLIGCAYDAKQSTALTFLPTAVSKGARIAYGARADRVLVEGGRAVGIEGTRIDPRTRQTVGRFRVQARDVIVAAGAIHSPLLLMRSGIEGGPLGQNLSLQPQLPVLSLFEGEVRAWRGIPQAYYLSEFEREDPAFGLGGFRVEGISGGPVMGAVSLALVGKRHKELMSNFGSSASSLVLIPDRPGGAVKAADKGNRARIDYRMQTEWKQTAVEAMRTIVEVYFAAGAQSVVLPTVPAMFVNHPKEFDPKKISFDPSRIHTISAHPQGTCRIGTDPSSSVVDPDGQHHRTKNLYVIDASVFPSSAATHTMIPIMGMADLLADRYLAAN